MTLTYRPALPLYPFKPEISSHTSEDLEKLNIGLASSISSLLAFLSGNALAINPPQIIAQLTGQRFGSILYSQYQRTGGFYPLLSWLRQLYASHH
jgi:hypothetical protein